jgi:hypothetical protein
MPKLCIWVLVPDISSFRYSIPDPVLKTYNPIPVLVLKIRPGSSSVCSNWKINWQFLPTQHSKEPTFRISEYSICGERLGFLPPAATIKLARVVRNLHKHTSRRM